MIILAILPRELWLGRQHKTPHVNFSRPPLMPILTDLIVFHYLPEVGGSSVLNDMGRLSLDKDIQLHLLKTTAFSWALST